MAIRQPHITMENLYDDPVQGLTREQIAQKAQMPSQAPQPIQPAQAVANPMASPVKVEVPQTVPTEILSNPVTNNDITNVFKEHTQKLDGILGQIQGYYNASPEEQQYQSQYADYTKRVNNLANEQDQLSLDTNQRTFELGRQPGMLTSIANSQISDTQMRAGFKMANLGVQQSAYARQQQVALQTLQNAQTSRTQKLEAAKFMYQANRDNMADTIQFYQATAPKSIGTVVDPQTGEMTVIMQNPLTGETQKQNLGVVQTPQKQIDNVKFAEEAGVEQPFYTRDGKTVVNTANGREYSSIEQAAADGVDVKDWSNVQQKVQSMARQSFGLQKDQFERNKLEGDRAFNRGVIESDRSYNLQKDQNKYQPITDSEGNQLAFNTKTGQYKSVDGNAINASAPDGSKGGQCGTFAHTIADFPSVGDSLAAKRTAVNKNGISAAQWREEGANLGDVLIFNGGKYGHVSVVTQDNGDGTVTVKDSNYGLDEKIQTRIVKISDAGLYGVIRGTLKDKFTEPTGSNPTLDAYAAEYASTGKLPTSAPKTMIGKVAATAKDLPKDKGTIVDNNTNVRSAKLNEAQYEAIASLYDIVVNKLPKLQKYNGKIDKSIVGKFGSAFYKTQDRQDFLTTRQEILNLLVKARSGAAVTEQEYDRYARMLPGDFAFINPGNNQIVSLAKSLQDSLGSQLKTRGVSIHGYSQIKVGNQTVRVGDVIKNSSGQEARVNPDGSLTLI